MLNVLTSSDAKKNLGTVLRRTDQGATVIITRTRGRNTAVISLERLNELEKAEKNLRYLQTLDESIESLKNGGIVLQSVDELRVPEESNRTES